MKKLITLILGLCLCFALMGCGGGNNLSNSFSEGEPNATAYYEAGNLYIPLTRIHGDYTVKSDKYIWHIKYHSGVAKRYPEWVKPITLPNKDRVVMVPEKYANQNYIIRTWLTHKYIKRKYHYVIEFKQEPKTLLGNTQNDNIFVPEKYRREYEFHIYK